MRMRCGRALARRTVAGIPRGGPQRSRAHGGDLVRVGLRGRPGRLQRVGLVARDHVHVEVEHGLPGTAPREFKMFTPSAPSRSTTRPAMR